MKSLKTIFATMMALVCMVSLTACSDNDDKEPATPAAKSVAGTYHGDMTCSVMGSESTFEDMTFTVTSTDDATVTVQISEFGSEPMKVPSLTISGVKVAGSDGTYSLQSTNFEGTASNGKNYSGVMQGSFADSKITIQFNLQYGAMPMPMICSFTAPKQ
ncbi:MAG: calycin-like domain-containing protein [Duncaniella sp.]|nr:calycin-like domain-containing protein [Duncaniella sp.]MDE6860049.1 calycin-like domain-containing protein [Duncaniella sp.]MDE7145075.1 calycin-like domain-containing protein [Duncaniella sp.]